MERKWGAGALIAVFAAVLGPSHVLAAGVAIPNSIVSTGDSITRAFDSGLDCLFNDCPQYSWSTGDSSQVLSHYRRLLALNAGISNLSYSLAKTGAKVADLPGQLAYAGYFKADYVTVLIGANDLCTSSAATMTPTATFLTEFYTALSYYFYYNPGGHVFVSSIPDILQLWTSMHTNQNALNTWALFKICQSMLSASNTDADRQAVVQQESVDNYILANVCTVFPNCRWDGNAAYLFKFPAADVSTIDYFHPNLLGQNDLAAVSWKASYWGA